MRIVVKVFILISIVAILNLLVFYMIKSTSEDQIRAQTLNEFVDSSQKLFQSIKTMEERIAHTVASILAKHPEIIRGYIDNNRSLIIEQTKDIWNTLSETDKLIYEIHYFKPPGNSFVNFHDLLNYGANIVSARNDVVETFEEETSSEHFWICRSYPGTRSTFPIKYEGRTVGVVSVGLHLINYSKLFSNSLNTKNMLIYNDSILKERLTPSNYTDFLKDKTRIEGWVIDSQFAKEYASEIKSIDFKLKKNNISINGVEHVFSSMPLVDKDNIINAYLLLIKPMEIMKQNSKLSQLLFYILLTETFFILLIVYLFIKKHIKRIYDLIKLLEQISHNEFNHVDDFVIKNDNNELSILEKHTVQMGKKLSMTFEDFSNNVEKFKFQSEHDPLTGLLNRRTLEQLGKSIVDNSRYHKLCVLMLDIDDFKKINDFYGHVQGDTVLKEISAEILSLVRKDDLVFRYGGEEFCVILSHTSLDQASLVAEKIKQHICGFEIAFNEKKATGEQSLSVTISGGLTEYTKEHKRFKDLIKTADQLLYQAKATGKNKIIVASR